MHSTLMDVCNTAQTVLIYGTDYPNAIRSMLQEVKGSYSLEHLTEIVFTTRENSLDHVKSECVVEARCDAAVSPRIVLTQLDAFHKCREQIKPSIFSRYWVYTESISDEKVSNSFDATIEVRDGRIIAVNFTPVNRSYEQQRTEGLGTWYAFCMSLLDDVQYRVSYQNIALLLINLYSFIEFACAKNGEARNLTTARRVLGDRYRKVLGDLFRLRLLFTTEPFSRKDIWEIMYSVLEDSLFYELLQLYFSNSYKELEELKQIKYLVAIEMDKEGL